MLVNDARKGDSIIKFTRIPAKKCLTSALFVVISQYDLDSLKGNNWVTEGVVEYYMDILHRNMDMDIGSTYSQLSTGGLRRMAELEVESSHSLHINYYVEIKLGHNQFK